MPPHLRNETVLAQMKLRVDFDIWSAAFQRKVLVDLTLRNRDTVFLLRKHEFFKSACMVTYFFFFVNSHALSGIQQTLLEEKKKFLNSYNVV